MSEYWVSKKKYFCKYCDIYIADDVPSRQQHENGLRHKGNVERFIRGLYKGSEKRKKDSEDERRDMARVEQAANAAFAQDVAAGLAKPSIAPVASTSTTTRKPLPKASNPYTNYSTAESLGFKDPDAERYAAEAECRRTQGVAGEWEIVSSHPPQSLAPDTTTIEDGSDIAITLKRGAEVPIDEEDARQFKLRKKTLNVGLGEVYDPGIIPIKLKKKEEPKTPPPTEQSTESTSKPTGAPKWTKVQWRRAGDTVKEEPKSTVLDDMKIPVAKVEEISVKVEAPLNPVIVDPPPSLSVDSEKTKPSIPHLDLTHSISTPEFTGSMFKKRKLPTGGNRVKRES